MFDHENVRGLNTIDPRAVLRVNARGIEALMLPGSHVGCGEPFPKQGKVRVAQGPE